MELGVLSIDWDYFINATALERLELFPDGGNEKLPESIQDLIWCTRYGDDRLKSIKTDRKSISLIKKVVNSIFNRVKLVYVEDSHKWIYDVVKNELDSNDYDNISLVNVDFHHDCYGISEEFGEVNCGNWMNFLSTEYYNINSLWVKREDSDSKSSVMCDYKVTENIKDSIEFLSNADRIIIYICMSGMWSPPHLDANFNRMCCDIINRVDLSDVVIHYNFDYNRYTKEFKGNVVGLSQSMKLMRMNNA